ncbi:MAG: general secretion pathway protein H [Oleiphilaceae bacterium]|jgi:general secretion pathway protein H
MSTCTIDISFKQKSYFKYGSSTNVFTKSKGFTLIEILVVLVLLGLISSIALTTVGGGNQYREMQNEVRRLQAVLLMASDEAVFSNEEIGVMIESDYYAFLTFDEEEGSWEDSQNYSLRTHALPEWITIDFQREGKERKILGAHSKKFLDGESEYAGDLGIMDGIEQGKKPNFMLLSSGEITGFTIGFQLTDQPDTRIEIKSTDQGDIVIPAFQKDEDD